MHKIYPLSFVPISPENGKTTRVATDARERVLRPRARESARDAISFVFFSRARPADLPLLLLRIFALSPFGRRRKINRFRPTHKRTHPSAKMNGRKKKQKKKTTTNTSIIIIEKRKNVPSRRLGFSTLSPVSRSRVLSARNSFASSGRRLSRRRLQRRT